MLVRNRASFERAHERTFYTFAATCREQAETWADNFDTYCFREHTPYGDHYVTAADPEHGEPAPDERPDAAAFMAYWPWNVVDAVADYVEEHAGEWTTSAGLLPERVDGDGTVSWNSNLQWSQATYVLLVESHRRDEPYGLAPAE